MSIELSKENLDIYKPLKTSKVKCVVDTDIIVPDVKPDVFSVLQVNAIPCIKEKYVQRNVITVSGVLDYTILYSCGDVDEGIKNIRYKSPFTEQIEVNGIDDELSNYVLADVIHIEYGIQNSRKINVKSVICFETGSAGKVTLEALSSITSTMNIPTMEEDIKMLNMSVCEEKRFSVTDEIRLSHMENGECEVLKIDTSIYENEFKTVNNKIVTKGCLSTDILYLSNGDICHTECEIPFTEVIDVANIGPHMHTETKYTLGSCDFDVYADNEEIYVSFNAEICLAIRGYDENELTLITDIYSPDFDINTETKELDVLSINDIRSNSFSVSETIVSDSDAPNIVKVYNMSTRPFIDSSVASNGFVVSDGYLDVNLLYLSNESERPIYSIIRKIPFSFKTESEQVKNGDLTEVDVTLAHAGYILKSEREVEIRATVKLSVIDMKSESKTFISSIEINEDVPLKKENQAGITIYFSDEGESLWDVAKRYRTTISEIAEINSVEEDATLKRNTKLLIPKRIVI